MEIRKMKISDLLPADYNPRKDLQPGDPEYEKLKRSIEEFGYVEPIVWNKRTGRVVGGHQRLKVLKELGSTEVECSIVDLDEDREKALNIALNKIEGDWDLPKLKDLLEEIDTGLLDIEVTGFDLEEIEQLMTQFRDEPAEDGFDVDEAVEEIKEKEPITQPGDIWRLGKHRVLCGDATSIEDVERLMAGKMADMVFTDPPYNVNYTGGTKDKLKIKNDNMDNDSFRQFLYDTFVNALVVTHPGGAIYVCHADSEGYNFRGALVDAGWTLKQCLIWVKNSIVMGRQDYHWKHEPILYGWKPGAAHKWFGGRKQSTVIDDPSLFSVKKEENSSLISFSVGEQTVMIRVPSYEVVYAGTDDNTTVWRFDKPTRNADHPTMKPVGIPARAIQNSCPAKGIVLDMFLGSGSTLIAAEQTGRACYGLELDPVYCDVIVRRWEEWTGKKAVKEGGKT